MSCEFINFTIITKIQNRHKTNANYENLVFDYVEKRMTNYLSFFSLLNQTLNFHNWHLFCVLQNFTILTKIQNSIVLNLNSKL